MRGEQLIDIILAKADLVAFIIWPLDGGEEELVVNETKRKREREIGSELPKMKL